MMKSKSMKNAKISVAVGIVTLTAALLGVLIGFAQTGIWDRDGSVLAILISAMLCFSYRTYDTLRNESEDEMTASVGSEGAWA